MIVLHSFVAFERLYLEVSKAPKKERIIKEEVCEVLSDEEIERRARNKALRELGPKQEESCPIDIVSVGETEV